MCADVPAALWPSLLAAGSAATRVGSQAKLLLLSQMVFKLSIARVCLELWALIGCTLVSSEVLALPGRLFVGGIYMWRRWVVMFRQKIAC
jgi:hypothetical protein